MGLRNEEIARDLDRRLAEVRQTAESAETA
jgi:hypothetical protein